MDKNSRGLGVAFRAAGALLPLAAWWALYLDVDRPNAASSAAPRAVSSVFKVIAYLWAWPDGVYRAAPLAFGALGLVGVLSAIVLGVRRDRLGMVTVLIWCFFWGWLMAGIIGAE